eukprot:NODE_130_length_2174_cov_144.667807_g107_i0.p1 GENE.NODE_130_length_2174_cov_144.667807_g107_i0~~NODE_130_length_2174_cov_144.667807_g107_i0.p1  ORF type:complete len:651 (+),score=155.58 NODE_130_length_2174_cov_144.667807_g107_i0:100-2052(+)
MASCRYTILFSVLLLQLVAGDVYLHMMRGSNNRLKAAGVNTQNQNRLFNSQNNAKGGYNVGSYSGMRYYVGSELLLEWTSQHGCNNPKDQCQIIIQYMCQDANPGIRDGTTEATPPDKGGGGSAFGQHEPFEYYRDCKYRSRNRGLFTADRRRFYDGRFYNSQYTRQNENGNRRGYECQEERDYYPYWHPTPWRDVAVLVDDAHFQGIRDMCDYYQATSENLTPRGYCTKPQHNNQKSCEEGEFYYPRDQTWLNAWRDWQRAEEDAKFYEHRHAAGLCSITDVTSRRTKADRLKATVDKYKKAAAGVWKMGKAHGGGVPRCRPLHPRSTDTVGRTQRVNHLGNTEVGQPPSFLWKIPGDVTGTCAMRLRYNMSSTDYPMWRTWSEHNGKKSPIFQNMKVPVGTFGKVELAINTNQIGRTFQDRSHTFQIMRAPSKLSRARIVNLNVRGKRGNIVQAYPAVEYDYHPNRMTICAGDYVHFQWTGSDTNPRNYAGQGTAGTDRHNIVQLGKRARERANEANWQAHNFQMNYPLEGHLVDMFPDPSKAGKNNPTVMKKFATLDQKDPLLNNAKSYFDYPPIQYKEAGKTYAFMCTRNNNFSNRSQKGFIHVKKCSSKTPDKLPEVHPGAVMEDLNGDYSGFAKKYGHPAHLQP